MNLRLTLGAALVSALGTAVVPALAHAQVTQPDGTVVPINTTPDAIGTVSQIFTRRGETNLTPPLTPFNAQANAQENPQTFRPGCTINFEVVARGAGDTSEFGWYNVDPTNPGPPATSELYQLVPPGSESTPMASGGVGYRATLDIRTDTRYRGHDIGFYLHNTSQGNYFYTQRAYQPSTVPGFVYALIYDSRVTPGAFYFAWEDRIVGDDSDFNDLIVQVGNLTCTGGGMPCKVDGAMGACAEGLTQCQNAMLTCLPITQATPERCDGIDNNCNGMTDEGDGLCAAGLACVEGSCVPSCVEGGCNPGQTCNEAGVCVETACVGVSCPDGQRCAGGTCVADCAGVYCPSPEICRLGRCFDPCAHVTCDSNSVCENGVCVADCHCRTCPDQFTCTDDGHCVPDACAGVTCADGLQCQDGTCVDSCLPPPDMTVCGHGQHCEVGHCVDDPLGAPDAGPDANPDASDASPDAPIDAHPDAQPDGGMDASADAQMSLGGESNCGCTVPGAPTSSPRGLFALAAVVAVALVRRRRGRLV